MATLAPIPSLSPYDGDIPGIFAFLGDLSLMRSYCMANDVFVSISMESQRPAKDYLKDLFKACNCAPVFSEGILKVIPWSEISTVGNGIIYTAPTSTGPIFDFTPDHFIAKSNGDPPLKITRPRLFDVVNIVSVQYVNRDREYNDGSVMASDASLIAQYGPIRSDPEKNEWIHDTDLAQRVAQLLLWGGDPTDPTVQNRGTIARLHYSFTLAPQFSLFEPMDLVTVTDLTQGIYRRPVRLLTLKEQTDMTIEVEAEDFIYGSHASPGPPISSAVVSTTTVGLPTANASPGPVNPPFIFEPLPTLDSEANSSVRIWIAVSGAGPNYGGCNVWLSTDGGVSYGPSPVAQVVGSAVMGYNTNDLPIAADPDTTDTLNVSVAESNGTLSSFTSAQTDLFESLCYITPGGTGPVNGVTVSIPYELISYESALLIAANQYALGSRIRRGVYGSPIADHPSGNEFAFLNSQIVKISLPLSYVGATLYFKFTTFNSLGKEEQNLADVVTYTYTVVGWPPTGSGGGFYINGNTP